MTEDNQDAFHPDNFGRVMLIMMMRLYDIQLATLSCIDPDKAKGLVEMHEQGITFMPAPAFSMESDETQETEQQK